MHALAAAAVVASALGTSCAHPGPPATAAPTAASTQSVRAPAPRPTVAPRPWSDEVLYFVLIDRFADGDPTNDANVDRSAKGTFHGGDLKGLRAHLDEIAGLGVTALWINPVVKNIDTFVTGAGFPDWGYHGYWADDFNQADPRFGSEAELAELVDACHARGIRVLLDVVYNHAGYLSRYTTDPKTKDWFRTSETGTCGSDDLTTCVSGLPDFKTELPEVQNYLLDAQLGWAKRSGVDGFRLDTVKHVDHPFWQEHRKRLRAQFPGGFFLLGEIWGGDPEVLKDWFVPDEIDAGFDFSFQGNAISFLLGRGRTAAFDHYLVTRYRTTPGHLLSQFLSSHDVPGALFQLQSDKSLFRLAAVLELTSVGLPMIYYGEEVGRAGGDWPDNRSDMPWGEKDILPGKGQPRDEALRGFYQKLIQTRRQHLALSRGTHTGLKTEGDLYVFAQRMPDASDAVVVAVNRGTQAGEVTVPAEAAWGTRQVVDALTGEPIARSAGGVTFSVAGHGARVLAVQP